MENIYHTIRGRTKSPRTLESISKDPLSAAKPFHRERHIKITYFKMLPTKTMKHALKHHETSMFMLISFRDQDMPGPCSTDSRRCQCCVQMHLPPTRRRRSCICICMLYHVILFDMISDNIA